MNKSSGNIYKTDKSRLENETEDDNLSGNEGLFVVLEGIDGSGKTSVGMEAVKKLNDMGHKSEFTFEPSDNPVGKMLREVLNGTIRTEPYTHALLFAADREEHLRNKVIPLLEKGVTVVCDRYVFASMAYQGARGLEMKSIWEMNEKLPHFLTPDLLILLDIDPETSLKRTSHRPNADIFESIGYLDTVRKNYLRIKKNNEMSIVNARMGKEEVVKAVLQLITEKLQL